MNSEERGVGYEIRSLVRIGQELNDPDLVRDGQTRSFCFGLGAAYLSGSWIDAIYFSCCTYTHLCQLCQSAGAATNIQHRFSWLKLSQINNFQLCPSQFATCL